MGLESKYYRRLQKRREGDSSINEGKDGRKVIDTEKSRAREKDELKDIVMKGEYMNLHKFRHSITNLGKYKDDNHPTTTERVRILEYHLKVIWDYKMRWLKEDGNLDQFKKEFPGWHKKPDDFKPDYYFKVSNTRNYTQEPMTRTEALNAFDRAGKYLDKLREDRYSKQLLMSGSSEGNLLLNALKGIKPLFDTKALDKALDQQQQEQDFHSMIDHYTREYSHKKGTAENNWGNRRSSPDYYIENTVIAKLYKSIDNNGYDNIIYEQNTILDEANKTNSQGKRLFLNCISEHVGVVYDSIRKYNMRKKNIEGEAALKTLQDMSHDRQNLGSNSTLDSLLARDTEFATKMQTWFDNLKNAGLPL